MEGGRAHLLGNTNTDGRVRLPASTTRGSAYRRVLWNNPGSHLGYALCFVVLTLILMDLTPLKDRVPCLRVEPTKWGNTLVPTLSRSTGRRLWAGGTDLSSMTLSSEAKDVVSFDV